MKAADLARGTVMLGIDPGVLNGVVTLWYSQDEPATVLMADEYEGGSVGMGAWVRNRLEDSPPVDRILMESWQQRSRRETRGKPEDAIEIIGVIRYLAAMKGVPFHTRLPGPPKSISDDLLEAAGMWLVGGKGHKRAILKHMLQQLCDEGHEPTMELVSKAGHLAVSGNFEFKRRGRK